MPSHQSSCPAAIRTLNEASPREEPAASPRASTMSRAPITQPGLKSLAKSPSRPLTRRSKQPKLSPKLSGDQQKRQTIRKATPRGHLKSNPRIFRHISIAPAAEERGHPPDEKWYPPDFLVEVHRAQVKMIRHLMGGKPAGPISEEYTSSSDNNWYPPTFWWNTTNSWPTVD